MTLSQHAARAAVAVACLGSAAIGADHREAPLIRSNLTADINDVFAFVSPEDESRLILMMTVNPFSAPSENTTYNFSTNARYLFQISNDGDAVPDYRIAVRFATSSDGGQSFRAVTTSGRSVGGAVTPPTLEPAPVDAIIAESKSDLRAFAGQRDDPFFFDVVGFNRFLAGTGSFDGSDGFGGYNVSAIIIDLPLADVSPKGEALQIWGETQQQRIRVLRSSEGLLQEEMGPWEQVDRMGNPAVNTALIPGPLKDLFNVGEPANDADDFAGVIVASLQALGTNEENIGILASVAVPDTLKLDPLGMQGFPNGRRPQDDVVDTLLFFIFNQTPVSDMVDFNDLEFASQFPFLALPHQPQ